MSSVIGVAEGVLVLDAAVALADVDGVSVMVVGSTVVKVEVLEFEVVVIVVVKLPVETGKLEVDEEVAFPDVEL